MAGARIIFPEFRDEQSDSRYPFADTATLRASTGNIIPRDLFFDASLYVINATPPLYLASIAIGGTITIVIGDARSQNVATTTYDPLKPPANGALTATDAFGRPAGVLLGTDKGLASLGGWARQTHTFARQATEFVSGVVIPAKEPGVRALTADGTSAFLTGDVWLVGRNGIVLRRTTPNTVRVDIVGVPLFKRAVCLDDTQQPISQFTPAQFLQTINNCGPDAFGNFTIAPADKSASDTTLRVYVEDGTLKIAAIGTKVI